MTQDFRPRAAFFTALVIALSLTAGPVAAADHRIGFGAHFWRTVDDFVSSPFDDIEDDGFAWVVSYRYDPIGLIDFQLDLEYYDSGFGGGSDSAVSPIAYVLVGGKIYGGLGLGTVFSDGPGDDVSDLFFAARVGYQIFLLPHIRLDINANYRTEAFEDLGGVTSDAVTLGAVVRFKL